MSAGLQEELAILDDLWRRNEPTLQAITSLAVTRFDNWNRLASEGHPEARLLMAICYMQGHGADG